MPLEGEIVSAALQAISAISEVKTVPRRVFLIENVVDAIDGMETDTKGALTTLYAIPSRAVGIIRAMAEY